MRATMTPTRAERKRTTAGFTMIELMMVIAILAFLMGAFAVLISSISDGTKTTATKTRLQWIKEGIQKFGANFQGQGAVPDRWGSDAAGGFETLPEDLDYPAGPDETLDKSSQYLAFWLGHHLLVWRTENQTEGLVRTEMDPAMKLTRDLLRTWDENLSGSEKKRIIDTLVDGFEDPDAPVTIGALGNSGSTKPEEVPVWKFDPDNTGIPAISDIKTEIEKIVIVDAWNRPIRYKVARDLSGRPTRYLLASAGPDGEWGNGDDIVLRFPPEGIGGQQPLEDPAP